MFSGKTEEQLLNKLHTEECNNLVGKADRCHAQPVWAVQEPRVPRALGRGGRSCGHSTHQGMKKPLP